VSRNLTLAVAQVGGINTDDSKPAVVARLIKLLEEAAGRGADLVVFPELTLTTFFPRTWFDDEDAVDRYFEKSMPNSDV
jgi:N-carbamoyl-D-amino-acid hydrolase